MSEKKYYAGIDWFRIIASLLVVAIHTSPLESFNETADFLLSGVIARVAVPFFFMASGFFLFSGHAGDTGKLWRFVKKTVVIYIIATLIYIPVNIQRGYFNTADIGLKILQDLIFDGTLYHLWYLPASIIGAGIVWCLLKKSGFKTAFAVTGILYVIGVLGDSYLGIVQQSPVFSLIYRGIFQVCDYTRNGIFFAPVFLLLGGYLADEGHVLSFRKSMCGALVSFALMCVEAGMLRPFEAAHHDSMYFFLLPCLYFLFSVVLYWEGKCPAGLKSISLVIYIIHPMMIVLIRPVAKILHLQEVLVGNSLVHYAAVCLLAFAVSAMAVKAAVLKRTYSYNVSI